MPDQPNFLILFSDQQRWDTVRAAGAAHMKTPNLDRLVEEGCHFRNAYSPNPICMPARHYLLTGAPARFHGYDGNCHQPILDDGLATIPRVLSDAGYATAAIGKMHFHPPRRHHGFETMRLMEELPASREEDAYASFLAEQGHGRVRNLHGVRPVLYHTPQQALLPAELHGTQWVAREAERFLQTPRRRPFFLMLGWVKPHPPWNVPEEWRGLYDDVALPEPIARSREFPYPSAEGDAHGDRDSEDARRAIRRAYFTSVSMVDAAVGRVLDCLEATGQLDDTFILFTSDHGEMLQDKGFYQKALPFESSCRIPFVVRSPRHFDAGAADERFVDLMDVFPTFLDAAGVEFPAKAADRRDPLAGESLLASAPGEKDRDVQFVECLPGRQRWAMVRDRRYKLVYYANGGVEHFYDLEEDPGEIANLMRTGGVPRVEYERLRRRLVEHEQRWGPEGAVVDGDLRRYPPEELAMGSFGKHPLWSVQQFQRFGEDPPEAEGRRFLEEALQAAPPEGRDHLVAYGLDDPEWRERLRENFRGLGGDPSALGL